ncbi:hypothetical protein J0H58_23210 [bacterium]|nr:hypothetical protein [bacterium]
MSEAANGAPRVADEGARARRRQYRITARLLKEYTARMYRIADQIGAYFDERQRSEDYPGLTHTAVTAVSRYRVLWEEVSDAALYASQMLVHFGFDEAESAELRLRLKDAEHAVARAGILVAEAIILDRQTFGLPIGGERMKGILRQSQASLPR